MAVAGLMMVLAVVVWLLTRRGHVRLACLLFPGALCGSRRLSWCISGVRLPIFHAYLFLIVIAGLLLGGRGALGFAGVSITASFGLLLAEQSGVLTPLTVPVTAASVWVVQSVQSAVTAVLMFLASRSLTEAFARQAQSHRALQGIRASLERQVEERTTALREANEILQRHCRDLEQAHARVEQQASDLERHAAALTEARNGALAAARLKSEFLATTEPRDSHADERRPRDDQPVSGYRPER